MVAAASALNLGALARSGFVSIHVAVWSVDASEGSGRVTHQMLYIVVAHGNGRPYISGVFVRLERAQAYLLEIPDDVRPQHEVTIVECGFPLFVLEDARGFRDLGSGEIVEAVAAYRNDSNLVDKDHEHAVLYCFKKGYAPEVPGADEMGSTRHWHITSETLQQRDAWLLAHVQWVQG